MQANSFLRYNLEVRLPQSFCKPRHMTFCVLCVYFALSILMAPALPRHPFVSLAWPYVISLLICAWVQADAREKGRRLCYDYDMFTFSAWPILTPIYLFQTRGFRAFIPIGIFIFLWIGALGLAAVLYS